MKDIIKHLLKEALGVPENITKIGQQTYDFVMNYLRSLPSDELVVNINNKLIMSGTFKIGDASFDKIKIKLKKQIVNQTGNQLPIVYGMAYKNKASFDPDNFRLVYANKEGVISLLINIALNKTTTVGELINTIEKDKVRLTMALTHELKHAYDGYKNRKSPIYKSSEYRVYSNIKTNIRPLDHFIHDLYYMTEIESLTRATEMASNIEQLGVTKKQFLDFLKNDENYNNLVRISNFSLENLIEELKQNKKMIKYVLTDAGYDIPETEDELISLILKLTFDLMTKHKVMSYQAIAKLNDPFMNMFMQMNSKSRKAIEAYQKHIDSFANYKQFFKYEEKRFRTVAPKLIKKLHKLYAIAKDDEQSPVMQKINTRSTNESILDWDMYYEANGIGETNPFKKDDERIN
jgi:hypothetical protein